MHPKFPQLIGHRGMATHAPENTLAGLRAAHVAGVTMVEFDAKLSGDDVPILIHDDTLDRTTDGHGNVRDVSFDILRQRDAGGWFGPSFAGEPIPTLAEALDVCGDLGLTVNIEIKPCPRRARQTAIKVLDIALDQWKAAWAPPLISSFEPECLIVAKDKAPDWPRGYLIDIRPDNWREISAAIAPTTINVDDARWNQVEWADYRETHLPILVYTVNDADRAKRLISQGATAIISDDPPLLAAAGLSLS
jgi:glycerophosphoryl diester phosphodiesterase